MTLSPEQVRVLEALEGGQCLERTNPNGNRYAIPTYRLNGQVTRLVPVETLEAHGYIRAELVTALTEYGYSTYQLTPAGREALRAHQQEGRE